MRGRGMALLVAVLVAGCGGDDSPSETEDSTGATAPARSAATTTASSTVAGEPVAEMAVLRPDGVGEVHFGTPAEEAITGLSAILGAPDRVESLEPRFADCVEGSSWLDCVLAQRVVDEGSVAAWDQLGLTIAVVDTDQDGSPAVAQFGDWHATVASGGTRLTTSDGIYPGMTAGALRQAVPGVEFTANEGALDSFATASADAAGYWGRLDWDPATADIDPVDVGAVQAALNEHGADLAVDGIWGPRSEAAWLAFLTEQGIAPMTPQLWLTPEIGAALGLPPDDVIVATIEPRQVEPGPASGSVTPVGVAMPHLRDDGLGRFDVGAPAGELVAELTSLFGPQTDEVVFSAPPPDRLHMPGGYQALHELAQYEWSDPQLLVIVGDTPYRGTGWGEPVPGSLHLITWETSGGVVRFENGLGVGSTLQDLRNLYPDVSVGQWDVCETDYRPAEFATAGPLPLRGGLDWDWVRDLQTALNERGADLETDGIYGPATTEAVSAFQLGAGIGADGSGAPGRAGPRTIAALGLVAPDRAVIDHLAAGYPGSC